MKIEYYQIFGREGSGEVFETLFINKNEDSNKDQHWNHYTLSVKDGEPNLKDYLGPHKTNMSKKLDIHEVKWCKTIITASGIKQEWSNVVNG